MTTMVTAMPIAVNQPPVPMARLIRIELRKLVNTRAAFWLVASMVIVTAGLTVALVATGGEEHLSLGSIFGMLNLPTNILLPVLGILLVTSEWSQRTALVTFSLEPRRSRVIAAKLATSVIMTVSAVAMAFAFAVAGTAAAGVFRGDPAGSWDLSGDVVQNALLLQLVRILEGFAFGMLIMGSAAAIVLLFALPTAWSILGSAVPWLADHVQPWADLAVAQDPFHGDAPFQALDALTATEWARFGTATAIWVAVPLVLGLWRVLRSETK